MLGKSAPQNQLELFKSSLKQMINPNHRLVLLSSKIDWLYLEKKLSKYYSHTGRKSMPIRFMVGCLLLKRLYNLGDETLAKSWVENPYFQYFCGSASFEFKFPCDPSDFVHFRKRIGEKGMEIIFSHTVKLHGKKVLNKTSLQDTTVQENNVTFPTDAKLAKKVIDRCNEIAKKENLPQRQNYNRISKQLLRDCHNATHPKRAKKAKKSRLKLQTIANRLLRELKRNLSREKLKEYQNFLSLFYKVVNQKRTDKDKIYSLNKPFTSCIAKGKAHKKYEFGNKIGLMMDAKSKVIQAIESYTGNPHDSNTIENLLKQSRNLLDYEPQEVIYDRGGRGKKQIRGTKIITPDNGKQKQTAYKRQKKRRMFRQRAGIEPVIGHLKKYYGMAQNYLSGIESPKMNALLAAAGWNLEKLMKSLEKDFLFTFFLLKKMIKKQYLFFLTKNKLSC